MKKLKVFFTTLLIFLTFFTVSVYSLPKKSTNLQPLNWDTTLYNSLNSLIKKYSINNENYDIRNKPYAIFDFDNTTSMNDVEEALLVYQLSRLEFKIPPEKMGDVLKTNVPKDNFTDSYKNTNGGTLNIDIVVSDCVSSYTWLYEHYKGFNGNMTLDEIQKTPEYHDFVTKVRFLYDAIGGTFSPDVSYPWVTYLFYGMTPSEVQALTVKSNTYWFSYGKYDTIKLTSPASLPGNAGVVSVSYKTGLRIMPEMKNLYNTLMDNGIEVYIVSASFKDVIVATACDPANGLNVKPSNVFAMELTLDDNSCYINKYNVAYFQTQGVGKTNTIEKFIKPNHGMLDPILVAGDSDGDYYMMKDFKNMEIGIIVNRAKGGNIGELCKNAADTMHKPNAVYYLQGRDENTGLFRKSPKSILLHSDEEKLLK